MRDWKRSHAVRVRSLALQLLNIKTSERKARGFDSSDQWKALNIIRRVDANCDAAVDSEELKNARAAGTSCTVEAIDWMLGPVKVVVSFSFRCVFGFYLGGQYHLGLAIHRNLAGVQPLGALHGKLAKSG